jgi:hypothetical protein
MRNGQPNGACQRKVTWMARVLKLRVPVPLKRRRLFQQPFIRIRVRACRLNNR